MLTFIESIRSDNMTSIAFDGNNIQTNQYEQHNNQQWR